MGGWVDKAEQLLVVFFEESPRAEQVVDSSSRVGDFFDFLPASFWFSFFLALALALDSSVFCVSGVRVNQQLLQLTVCVAPMMTQFERHP